MSHTITEIRLQVPSFNYSTVILILLKPKFLPFFFKFIFKLKVNNFRMSRWDADDLKAEDYDPDKPLEDYSVQVQRRDGGLASTQVIADANYN